jgi:hypothetical protein
MAGETAGAKPWERKRSQVPVVYAAEHGGPVHQSDGVRRPSLYWG